MVERCEENGRSDHIKMMLIVEGVTKKRREWRRSFSGQEREGHVVATKQDKWGFVAFRRMSAGPKTSLAASVRALCIAPASLLSELCRSVGIKNVSAC